jgi:hypothetical protein
MKILRFFLVAFVVVAALLGGTFYVLANHSVTRTDLTCSGTWEQGVGDWKGHSETVLVAIEEYRPWIVWANSQGNLRATSREWPMALYAPHLQRIGSEPMTMYQFSRDSDGAMIGGYRSSFREMTLKFAEGIVFAGACEQDVARPLAKRLQTGYTRSPVINYIL